MLSFEYNRMSNVFVDANVGVTNHNFKFPLILDKYNVMIVMKKLKFTQNLLLLSMLSVYMAVCRQNY